MTRIPLDEYNSNKHRFRRLDDLVRQIEETAAEIYKLSFVALKGVVEAQGPYFQKSVGLSLHRIGEPDVKLEATPSTKRAKA